RNRAASPARGGKWCRSCCSRPCQPLGVRGMLSGRLLTAYGAAMQKAPPRTVQTDPPEWLSALLGGDRAALARAITAVENDTAEARAVLQAIRDKLGRAVVVGFTGAPGAGKSTLVSAYVRALRERGQTVGVV